MAGEGQTIRGEDALYEVAYEEALRALSEQLSLIDSFRTRAGLLFSTAAITTSVLGSQALDHPIGYAAWAALASFFAIAILSLALLRQREWGADSPEIVRSCITSDSPGSVADLRWDLTTEMHRSYAANWDDLGQMVTLFEIASRFLVAEILSWLIALAHIV